MNDSGIKLEKGKIKIASVRACRMRMSQLIRRRNRKEDNIDVDE